jgi:hypothetical protein
MSKIDNAIISHMHYIVVVENRPFSYKDFEKFQLNGIWQCVAHGTFRNKISDWTRKSIVELVYKSKIAFYTLKGYNFNLSNSVTVSHMGLSPVINVIPVTAQIEAENFLRYLKTLDITADSVHDIHLKFTVPNIYRIISSNSEYSQLINPNSKDIKLETQIIDDKRICTIIHRTDTVTLTIACSRNPITLNERGITDLSCILTRVEERLSTKLNDLARVGFEHVYIPDNRRWQITLWHFGKDKFANEYPSKGYALTWGHGRDVLRFYLKNIKNSKVNRSERQESPNKSLYDALNEKRQEEE